MLPMFIIKPTSMAELIYLHYEKEYTIPGIHVVITGNGYTTGLGRHET